VRIPAKTLANLFLEFVRLSLDRMWGRESSGPKRTGLF